MACECGCGCCGPLRDDSDVQPRAELEEQKREAERRAQDLARRVSELETAAA